MSPLVGRVAREGGRCEFRCPLEERGENRRIHFDGGEILLRSIEISHGEGGGWRSLISKDEGVEFVTLFCQRHVGIVVGFFGQ